MSERASERGQVRAGGGSARGRLPDRGARFVARSRALRVSRRARAPRGVPFLLSSSPPPAAASLPLFLPPRWRRCSRSAASPPKLFPALRSAPRRYRPLPPSYEKKRKKKRARRGREGGTRGRRLFCLKPPTFRPFLLIRRGALREKSRRERAGGARGGGSEPCSELCSEPPAAAGPSVRSGWSRGATVGFVRGAKCGCLAELRASLLFFTVLALGASVGQLSETCECRTLV